LQSLFLIVGPLIPLQKGRFPENIPDLISQANILLHIAGEKMGFGFGILVRIRIRRFLAISPHLSGRTALPIFLNPFQSGSGCNPGIDLLTLDGICIHDCTPDVILLTFP
jgi:hypothetical protein